VRRIVERYAYTRITVSYDQRAREEKGNLRARADVSDFGVAYGDAPRVCARDRREIRRLKDAGRVYARERSRRVLTAVVVVS